MVVGENLMVADEGLAKKLGKDLREKEDKEIFFREAGRY